MSKRKAETLKRRKKKALKQGWRDKRNAENRMFNAKQRIDLARGKWVPKP